MKKVGRKGVAGARKRARVHAGGSETRIRRARGYIPQGCDSRTMYGYWAAGGIDSHDEGATDHPETETPAVPQHPPASPPRPAPATSTASTYDHLIARFHSAAKYFIRKLHDFPWTMRVS